MTRNSKTGLTLAFSGKIYFRILGLGLGLGSVALALVLHVFGLGLGLLALALTPLALLTSLQYHLTRKSHNCNLRNSYRSIWQTGR